jgi:G:T-mismatch repair DNA endonuclease (very short patch repair protein)
MICHLCYKELSPTDNKHIYFCAVRRANESKDETRFRFFEFNSGQTFDKIQLEDWYLSQQLSLVDIASKLGISYSAAQFLIRYFCLPLRSLKEATNTSRRKEKFKESCIKEYGVSNPSKSLLIKEKKKDTSLKNYGVDNVRKSAWFKEYYKKTMHQKYGVGSLPNRDGNMQKWWNSQTDEAKKLHMKSAQVGWKKFWNNASETTKNNIIQKRAENGSYVGNFGSSLEDRLSSVLTSNDISHTRQKWIGRNSYDFLIDGSKLIIEVNGDFWHMNPDLYGSTDMGCSYKNIPMTAEQIWQKDYTKKILAENSGYRVLYIWESDFKRLTDAELFEVVFQQLL